MLNGAQFHLLLNHLPVLTPVLALPILLFGLWRGKVETRNVGAALILVGALFAIPAYLTGESAEDVVKNYPDVSRLLIHDHEEFALISLIILEAAGALSIALLYGAARGLALARNKRLWQALVALTLLACAAMGWAAHLGGLIRHEEIRTSQRY